MEFHWPQITYLCLALLGLGVAMEQHGKPKTGKHSVFAHVFALVLAFWLLYCGGFFGGN